MKNSWLQMWLGCVCLFLSFYQHVARVVLTGWGLLLWATGWCGGRTKSGVGRGRRWRGEVGRSARTCALGGKHDRKREAMPRGAENGLDASALNNGRCTGGLTPGTAEPGGCWQALTASISSGITSSRNWGEGSRSRSVARFHLFFLCARDTVTSAMLLLNV